MEPYPHDKRACRPEYGIMCDQVLASVAKCMGGPQQEPCVVCKGDGLCHECKGEGGWVVEIAVMKTEKKKVVVDVTMHELEPQFSCGAFRPLCSQAIVRAFACFAWAGARQDARRA